MPEAVIKTTFGEIRLTYASTDELTTALQGLGDQIKAIEEVAAKVNPRPRREPKPGFEELYRFTPDGKVELLRTQSTGTKTAALVLWAYAPDTATIQELEQVTGIANVATRVIGQTLTKKYFVKRDEHVGLSPSGAKLAQSLAASSKVSIGKGETSEAGNEE